ncbi:MAG: hypothetical protein JJU02_10240 [Cryomorphaceae bacterium]|nr:hypothetical protein [Cryomorphaceae bacterium]
MIRIVTLLLCLFSIEVFSQNKHVAAFLGKRNLIGIQHNMVPLPTDIPHGPHSNSFRYSFVETNLRYNNILGLTYEHIFSRRGSFRLGLNYYSAYLPTSNKTISPPHFDEIFNQDPNRYTITENKNVKSENTQVSIGFRLYENLAPVSVYMEGGVTGIFYRTDTHNFTKLNSEETIDLSASGMTWNFYFAGGYSFAITKTLMYNFGFTAGFRTFGAFNGFNDHAKKKDLSSPEDIFNEMTRFSSLSSVWLGLRTSLSFAF